RVHPYERSLLASIITPVLSKMASLTGPSLLGRSNLVNFCESLRYLTSHLVGKRVGRGRFLSDCPPQGSGAAAAGASPPEDNGRSNEDRGVSSDYHANNNGKGKVAQHRAAEEKQTKNRDEGHRACKNRAAKRLVDTFVHDLLDCTATTAGETFSDPVVDDNGVVDGVAGDREDSADHGERQFASKEREHADRDEDIVQECNNRPHCKGKLKAKGYED